MLLSALVMALGLLAPSVIADGAAIVSALQAIDAETQDLTTAVQGFDGTLNSAKQTFTISGHLLNLIGNGTSTASASAPLTTEEAVNVYIEVLQLQNDVNDALNAVVNVKPEIQVLDLVGSILLDLELTKNGTDLLSAAIIDKVPSDLQPIATPTVDQIDASFESAIAAYQS